MEFRTITKYKKELAGRNAVFLLAGFPVFYQISPCLLIPYFGFFIIGVALIFADIFEQRVVVNQKGIEYYGVGFAVEVTWKSITKVDTDLLLGEEGLFVDKSNVISKTQYFNLRPYKGFREKFFIPLSRFSKNWRDSELGAQIKQYAPQLFEKENKQPA